MKLKVKIGCSAAAVMTTAMTLFAETGAPKTIKVVGLEDDKDNATVVAPAELGAKPAAVAISADALTTAAAADSRAKAEAKANTANVKALTVEGMVIPPGSDLVKTLEEAVRNILVQAGKQVGTVSSNGIEKLTMPYQQLGDGKSYEVEWRKALRLLLSPAGYNFTEDGELVLFGLSEEVDVKHKQLSQERLTANRTPILFTTNESEGGMELRNAIRDVAVKADVTITTDYMEPADLYVPTQASATEGTLSAAEIGKAKEKSTVQQAQVKRTKFDTNGQQIEWRTVLREILNPHDYDFVEMGGVVRIAKRAKLAQWEQEKIAQKPLSAKVIRLYHADPEQVVERLKGIKGLLKHPNASLQATRKKDDNTETVKNLNARIQTSSGQQSGMSDTTSQVFDKLVRPRTVPAIVAYDVEENIAEIEAKVKLFDIKEKQILIEAIIFQLDTNNGNGDMDGIKWEGFDNFTPLYGSFGNPAKTAEMAIETVKEVVDGAQTSRDQYNPGFSHFHNSKSWVKTGSFDFKATIQLIRQQENAKLLSSPMIVVGDHSEAAIQVSNVDPIPQIEASSFAGMAGQAMQNNLNIQWNMLRSGVLMWVAPEITENGTSVRLTVHPQVITKGNRVDLSELGGTDNTASKFKEYPIYNYELKMHEMDTRATVPSGATLMFGGLIDNEETEVEDKVRWLGDLPVIGWLFRSKVKTIVQKNLIIMIRPTILEDTDTTGFETNALKEVEAYSENTGRDLRKRPNGPYSVKEIKENVRELYEERVVKPFKDEDGDKSAETLKEEKPAGAEGASRPPEQSVSVTQVSQTSSRKRGLLYAFD